MKINLETVIEICKGYYPWILPFTCENMTSHFLSEREQNNPDTTEQVFLKLLQQRDRLGSDIKNIEIIKKKCIELGCKTNDAYTKKAVALYKKISKDWEKRKKN